MAGRPERFISNSFDLAIYQFDGLSQAVDEAQKDIVNILLEEKMTTVSYAEAWSKAEQQYEVVKTSMNPNFQKVLSKSVDNFPPELKPYPDMLPTAVLLYCHPQCQEFSVEFDDATKMMLSSQDWESFAFKSLFLLLKFAIEKLPSRPPAKAGKLIHRGINSEVNFKEGEVFSFGHFASFTVNRYLALGKRERLDRLNKPDPAEDEDCQEGEACDDDFQEDDFLHVEDLTKAPDEAVTKTVLTVKCSENLSCLGIRFYSLLGNNEREVLVYPTQKFKIVKVLKNPRCQVVRLRPLE